MTQRIDLNCDMGEGFGAWRSRTGQDVPVQADTVCLHGDQPKAVDFAQRLRVALEVHQVVVLPLQAG